MCSLFLTTCVGIIVIVESSSEPISEHFQYKSFKSPSWIILGASGGVVLLIMIRKVFFTSIQTFVLVRLLVSKLNTENKFYFITFSE